jgi:hypothetical protein
VASIDIYPASGKTYTTVPLSSIIDADGRSGYVFALTGNDTVRRLRVDIESLPGEMAAISRLPSGVQEIVSEGGPWLRDGMKVTVVRDQQ